MQWDQHNILVNAKDKIVYVDNDAYFIDASHFPAGLISMKWNPTSEAKTKGHLAKQGDAYGFDDFAQIEPFLAPWQAAKTKYDAAVAKRDAALEEMRALKP
jgi:hypothetical protein